MPPSEEQGWAGERAGEYFGEINSHLTDGVVQSMCPTNLDIDRVPRFHETACSCVAVLNGLLQGGGTFHE